MKPNSFFESHPKVAALFSSVLLLFSSWYSYDNLTKIRNGLEPKIDFRYVPIISESFILGIMFIVLGVVFFVQGSTQVSQYGTRRFISVMLGLSGWTVSVGALIVYSKIPLSYFLELSTVVSATIVALSLALMLSLLPRIPVDV